MPNFDPERERLEHVSGDQPDDGAQGRLGLFDKFMSTMFPAPPAAPTTSTVYVQAPAQGMDQNTMIALGLGAAGLLAIVMIASRK